MPSQKITDFEVFGTAEVYYVFFCVFYLKVFISKLKNNMTSVYGYKVWIEKDHPRGLQNRGIQLSFIKPFKKINPILWENRNRSSMKMKSLLKIPLLKMVKIRDSRWVVLYPHAGLLFYS